MKNPMALRKPVMLMSLCLAGCSMNDARVSSAAQKNLLGMSELQIETCAGVPDSKTTTDGADIFQYNMTSTSSTGLSIPLIGGISKSYGGSCHTIFRFDNGKVASVRYTGENGAFLAPEAFCAPIVRACVYHPPAAGGPAMGAAPAAAVKKEES